MTTGAPASAAFGRWSLDEARAALLLAYGDVSLLTGTRLYQPMREVREALRRRLAGPRPRLAPRRLLDEVLRAAPALLPGHLVSFSPFSGATPRSAGGLEWVDPFGLPRVAGFLSVRPRPRRSRCDDRRPRGTVGPARGGRRPAGGDT